MFYARIYKLYICQGTKSVCEHISQWHEQYLCSIVSLPWSLCYWLLNLQAFLSPISDCLLLEASLCFALASDDQQSHCQTERVSPASLLRSWGCRAWTGPPYLINTLGFSKAICSRHCCQQILSKGMSSRILNSFMFYSRLKLGIMSYVF